MSTYILPFKNISKTDVSQAGGKGASLGEMTQAGIAVPPGFVVLASAFDRFIEETDIKEEIEARIAEVNPEDVASIERASSTLRDAIHDTPMPEDLANEIVTAHNELGADFVAIRSSATAEDSEVASWAGELDTFLNVEAHAVVEKVKHCWSSLFTPRAIFYRYEKNLAESYVGVAVVVQNMIQSEISGIAFTVHPVTEDRDQMIIEAGYGLGEAIVSGQITPDSYIVSKSEMSIMDIHVGTQIKKMMRNTNKKIRNNAQTNVVGAGRDLSQNEGVNVWIPLDESEGGKQKLTGKQIIQAAKQFKIIEDHYGFPCDIEWAIAKGELYITQSRPITTLK